MDPRRYLILTLAAIALSGCGTLRDITRGQSTASTPPVALAPAAPPIPPVEAVKPQPAILTMAPIPNPPALKSGPRRHGREGRVAVASRRTRPTNTAQRVATQSPTSAAPVQAAPATSGRTAIADANLRARETSRSDAFIGGMQVFTYDPGRVYEVWTAPLRVTTLTLAPGETVVSKAAGDTVRWQIGETTSGQGLGQRSHVMIKPLERGLETNLVLATSQRVYLILLRSGPPETFNAAVSWDLGAAAAPGMAGLQDAAAVRPDPLVTPAGPLDARYRIVAKGRRPAWTPTSVMTDGVHTFLTFPPELASQESPALFVIGPGGDPQMVNYRQQGGLWVVDRVFDQAELRVGDKHAQVVRIIREGGRS